MLVDLLDVGPTFSWGGCFLTNCSMVLGNHSTTRSTRFRLATYRIIMIGSSILVYSGRAWMTTNLSLDVGA